MYQFINEMEVTIKSINKKFLKFKARIVSDSIARKPDSNQKSSRSRKSVIKAEEFPLARIGTAMLLSASYSFSGSTDRKEISLSTASNCSSSSSSAASLSTTSADSSSSNSISTTAGKEEHSKIEDRKKNLKLDPPSSTSSHRDISTTVQEGFMEKELAVKMFSSKVKEVPVELFDDELDNRLEEASTNGAVNDFVSIWTQEDSDAAEELAAVEGDSEEWVHLRS